MTEADPPAYEIYAIRYARRDARRSEHFIGGDPHEGPMPMDYFLWAIIGAGRTIVVDAGFTAETAVKRKREFLRCPIEALRLIGVEAETVRDVVLTHLHYDHVGNFHRFPVAQFHLQEAEMHYATGHYMRYARLRHSFEVEDVAGIIRLTYADRVTFHDGPAEVAPGVTLHPVGGHSDGLQFVRVSTRRGPVVLASDTTHFYENMETMRPFTTAFHIGKMLVAFDALRAAAPTPEHIIPGHDPEVMRRYAPPRPELEGIVARLDLPPRAG